MLLLFCRQMNCCMISNRIINDFESLLQQAFIFQPDYDFELKIMLNFTMKNKTKVLYDDAHNV